MIVEGDPLLHRVGAGVSQAAQSHALLNEGAILEVLREERREFGEVAPVGLIALRAQPGAKRASVQNSSAQHSPRGSYVRCIFSRGTWRIDLAYVHPSLVRSHGGILPEGWRWTRHDVKQ